jgi:hypothetical protein
MSIKCAPFKPFDTNRVKTQLELKIHRKPVTQLNSEN